MSDPSVVTDSTSSTIISEDMSIIVNDSSDTTVATQTSASWHSVVSDIHINNNLLIRPNAINIWLKKCFIEPDIRLTTAQEWKLRTCIRRFISICNLPLKISCIQSQSIPFIDQEQHISSIIDSSLIIHPWLKQGRIVHDKLEELGLYLHIVPNSDAINGLLEVKLFEFYSNKTQNIISIIKSPKLLFHISLNILKLSLRSSNSLLELHFPTRENELIRGYYYQWNEINNEHLKYNITIDVDQSLINKFNTI